MPLDLAYLKEQEQRHRKEAYKLAGLPIVVEWYSKACCQLMAEVEDLRAENERMRLSLLPVGVSGVETAGG